MLSQGSMYHMPSQDSFLRSQIPSKLKETFAGVAQAFPYSWALHVQNLLPQLKQLLENGFVFKHNVRMCNYCACVRTVHTYLLKPVRTWLHSCAYVLYNSTV